MTVIKPYENEEESFAIGDLTIENRLDRVCVYGSIELTKDKAGLLQARALKTILDAVVRHLESDKSLADHIATARTGQVRNPFS